MKKIISLLLVLFMIVALGACGGPKAADISIADLENAMGISASKQKTDNGFTFSVKGTCAIISGEANKDEKLINVCVKYESMDEKQIAFLEKCTLNDVLYDIKNYEKVKGYEMFTVLYLMACDEAVSMLSYGNSSVSKSDTQGKEIVLNARSSTVTENGWKYSMNIDKGSGVATFLASYVGY